MLLSIQQNKSLEKDPKRRPKLPCKRNESKIPALLCHNLYQDHY